MSGTTRYEGGCLCGLVRCLVTGKLQGVTSVKCRSEHFHLGDDDGVPRYAAWPVD